VPTRSWFAAEFRPKLIDVGNSRKARKRNNDVVGGGGGLTDRQIAEDRLLPDAEPDQPVARVLEPLDHILEQQIQLLVVQEHQAAAAKVGLHRDVSLRLADENAAKLARQPDQLEIQRADRLARKQRLFG
jgi:hypothetical protein